MTAVTAIRCDALWPGDRRRCSASFPAATVDEVTARLAAVDAGWAAHPQRGDLCPAHNAMHKGG